MSGDMRVKSNLDGGLGTARRLEEIDAHSSQSGDFTEARRVGGKEVFLTAEGAQRFDSHSREGYRYELLDDPAGFFERLMAPRQVCSGEVER